MKKLIGILFLILWACEPTDYSSGECCWKCAVQTTWYYPGEQPYEVTGIGRYEFCDYTDDVIHEWEINNTYTDTIDGLRMVQIAKCRK
jgi:hypothetical protein